MKTGLDDGPDLPSVQVRDRAYKRIEEKAAKFAPIQAFTDQEITAEYFRRLRIHKAKLVEAGGKTGGWVKGRPRKVDGGVEGVGGEGVGVEGVAEVKAEGDQ